MADGNLSVWIIIVCIINLLDCQDAVYCFKTPTNIVTLLCRNLELLTNGINTIILDYNMGHASLRIAAMFFHCSMITRMACLVAFMTEHVGLLENTNIIVYFTWHKCWITIWNYFIFVGLFTDPILVLRMAAILLFIHVTWSWRRTARFWRNYEVFLVVIISYYSRNLNCYLWNYCEILARTFKKYNSGYSDSACFPAGMELLRYCYVNGTITVIYEYQALNMNFLCTNEWK
jgi:hypothetical protein